MLRIQKNIFSHVLVSKKAFNGSVFTSFRFASRLSTLQMSSSITLKISPKSINIERRHFSTDPAPSKQDLKRNTGQNGKEDLTQDVELNAEKHLKHSKQDAKGDPNTKQDAKEDPNTKQDAKGNSNTKQDAKEDPNTKQDAKGDSNTKQDAKRDSKAKQDAKEDSEEAKNFKEDLIKKGEEQKEKWKQETLPGFVKLVLVVIASCGFTYLNLQRVYSEPNIKFWSIFSVLSGENPELEDHYRDFIQNNQEHGINLKIGREIIQVEGYSIVIGAVLGFIIGGRRFKAIDIPKLMKRFAGFFFGTSSLPYVVSELSYFGFGRNKIYLANAAFALRIAQLNLPSKFEDKKPLNPSLPPQDRKPLNPSPPPVVKT